MLRIGAHVSTRDGFLGAAHKAASMGANAFQFFPKNPRSLIPKTKLDAKDASACANWCAEQGIVSIGHAPYALNLAVDPEQASTMLQALLNGLLIADLCGALGLVVHFGKYAGADKLQGYRNIVQMTNLALKQWNGRALLLLENQAGEGTTMGLTLDEPVTVRRLSDFPEKIGFCLDTCHLFASGVWNGRNWTQLEEAGRQLGYFDHLKAIHLNDSVYPHGSRKDRHAPIGQGAIGPQPLRELLQSDSVRGVPLFLETPPEADGTHRNEIQYVKHLISS